MDKRFLGILLGVIVLIFGIFLFTRSDTANSPSTDAGGASVSNHSRGNLTSSVEVIEYADFQCPACASFSPIVDGVFSQYGDRVKFTFRHFPLDTIHQNARAAHRAAEAAGLQGKFFEMHDLLFQNQQLWGQTSNPVDIFNGYAEQLGLNVETFRADFVKQSTNNTINADTNEGQDKGVDATPTFFINGQKLQNDEIGSVDAFASKIEEALAATSNAAQAPAQ